MPTETHPVPALAFRVDISQQLATGHAMRCLALAQAYRSRGGRTFFCMTDAPSAFVERLAHEQVECVIMPVEPVSQDDVQETTKAASTRSTKWVVVDGYHFTPEYITKLRESGLSVAFVDDFGIEASMQADLVINHNAGASRSLYERCASYTSLLLGTRFLLLRHELAVARHWVRTTAEKGTRLLVACGGLDAENVTLKVLRALHLLPRKSLSVTVLVGAANAHWETLLAEREDSPQDIHLVRNSPDISGFLKEADLAVAAAGMTAWELAHWQVPQLLVTVADNQQVVAEGVARSGAGEYLGEAGSVSEGHLAAAIDRLCHDVEKRVKMAAAGAALVDGHGADRVAATLRNEAIHFTPARAEDAATILEWANDPLVRAASFSQESISWEDHQAWLAAKLADPDCQYLVARSATGKALGQVRFDRQDHMALVSISLASAHRGRGLGTAIIRRACESYLREHPVDFIVAQIKSENTSSQRAFLDAGFHEHSRFEKRGQPAMDFRLHR